ncbi:MAG: hypothetical protein ACOYB0_09675 [Polynucleobacter sp.]
MSYKGTILGSTWQEDENPLAHALRALNLEGAGDNVSRLMMETVIDKAYDLSRDTAPVNKGEMRDSIYKEIILGRYLIRGKVAIPDSIPYGPSVVYGDKRHPNPNRFMEKALDNALKYMNDNFPSILSSAFGSARGKV